MSVVSVALPTRNLSRLGISALVHGVALNAVEQEREDGTSYVDLAGSVEKCLAACIGKRHPLDTGMGVKVLDVTESTEKDGIPEEDEARRLRTYSNLMQGPR